ncbi:hypothetical protein BH09BAC5_BH09BAC5_24230 [soil metagenome]
MKTLYSTLIAAFVAGSAFAQSNMITRPEGHHTTNQVQKSIHTNNSAQSTMNFYTDYAFMDEDYQVNTQGLSYSRYIWDMNMRYNLANGDTSLRWGVVDFDPLFDSYNGSIQIAANSYNSITVDSVFFYAGHSNYSGMNDTILVRIVQCTATGYPNATATVLHTDTIISNTSLTASSTWLSTGVLFTTPNFTMNSSVKFAVKIEYYGSALDTFGMTAGFGDQGPGQCASNSALQNFAQKTNYYANSYRHDMRFAAPPYNIQQLPTSTNQDTYYDCDGDNSYTQGSDSENFMQNWDLWINATIDGVGIDETNGSLGVGQNIPNPSTGNTEIPYELKNNSVVTLSIFDVTGNEVMSQKENASVGHHTFNVDSSVLSAGVYYYTVSTSEGSITHKMIVSK